MVEGARGEAGDLGQDWEEGPQAGPLGLPALKDFEDTQAHISDLLLFVTLGQEHRGHQAQLPRVLDVVTAEAQAVTG